MWSRFSHLAVSSITILVLLLAGCGSQPGQTQQGSQPSKSGQGVVSDTKALPSAGETAKPAASPTPESFGKAQVKYPEPQVLAKSATWGEVPTNQVAVMLRDGLSRADAERVAQELGGTIVGEVELINLYQVETKGTTEADLLASLEKASKLQGVEVAFPNARSYPLDSACRACSPLNDPVYGEGDNGKHYEMIGLKNAWDILKASGVKLNDVTVGVMDQAIYTKSDEVRGKTRISGIDKDDSTDQPATDDRGNVVDGGFNHGTMVTHVIGADPDNGGVAGVAGFLGDKLTIKVGNIYKAGANSPESAPDPNDPTKVVWSNGKTYVVSDFVDAIKQIKSGATIINCSFGPEKPNAKNKGISDAWKQFLQKVHKKYPKVLFVAAAGNEKGALDGSNYSIGGHKLPNLITVGALDNQGNRAKFSNYSTGDGEVTISAPGVQVPMGVGPDGKTVKASGTSFATPMVAAAAALIRSINPNLSAEQIRKVLEDTAAPGVTGEKQSVPIPQGMGKGVLRVDEAVLKVINDMRAVEKKPPLTRDSLVKLTSIDGSVSSKNPKEFTVRASIAGVGEKGTEVSIQLMGEGMISSSSKKKLAAAGDVTWDVSILDEKKKPTVRLCRLDTNSCCDVSLEVVELNGRWTGSLIIADVKVAASEITIPDPFDDTKPPTVITKEDCEKAVKAQMGKPGNLSMEFQAQSSEAGTVVIATGGQRKADKSQALPYRFDGKKVIIDTTQKGFTIHFEGEVAIGDQEYTMTGPFSMVGRSNGVEALRIVGTFKIAKPKQ
ncbi:MAG: S8 family serine peptidase [Chloroflexi bacterium]|nr:S8 family serine peptidase [Chloroflexota bacterium]